MFRFIRSSSAILLGFISVILSFFALGFLSYFFVRVGSGPLSDHPCPIPAIRVFSFIQLMTSTAIGGFVTSWFSRKHPMRDSAALGGILVLAAFLDGLPPTSHQPVWFSILSVALLMPAAAIGFLGTHAIDSRWRSGDASVRPPMRGTLLQTESSTTLPSGGRTGRTECRTQRTSIWLKR